MAWSATVISHADMALASECPSGAPSADALLPNESNGITPKRLAAAPQILETEKINAGSVRRLASEVDGKELLPSEFRYQRDAALQGAANDVRAAGYQVTQHMLDVAMAAVREGKGDLKEQMYKVLLRESAIDTALRDAAVNPTVRVSGREEYGREAQARVAASRGSVFGDYEAMYTSALRALMIDQTNYVVTVNSYKHVGVNILLSFSTISGDAFNIQVGREASVDEVRRRVQQEKSRQSSTGFGKSVSVKIVSPGGAVLHCHQLIKTAVDLENEVLVDEEDGEFYPLSVLTGVQWKEIGLPAKTRWQHLREKEFSQLFGMSKSTFEQLPDWKQIPLKKKHGLF